MTAPGWGPFRALAGADSHPTRPANFLASFAIHFIGIALLLRAAHIAGPPRGHGKTPQPPLDPVPIIFTGEGGGGGGTRDLLPASAGALPRLSLEDQLAPPEARIENENPSLPVEPTLLMASNNQLPQLSPLGDPLARVSGPASNGPGGGGGIGAGCCGGVGDSKGPHFGPGPGGIYVAGRGGVMPPRLLYDPEPAYSDAARAAKLQGKVVLVLVVGPDGQPRDIRVQKGLGLGLDEKAVEAVRTWRFEPSRLDGRPVAVAISVEVSFRLY